MDPEAVRQHLLDIIDAVEGEDRALFQKMLDLVEADEQAGIQAYETMLSKVSEERRQQIAEQYGHQLRSQEG